MFEYEVFLEKAVFYILFMKFRNRLEQRYPQEITDSVPPSTFSPRLNCRSYRVA